MVPLGQKCGEMSFSVSWEFGSHHSASPLIQPTMNSPVRCTRRACRIVNGEAPHHANPTRTMATMKSGNPAQLLLCTPMNILLVFCRRPVTNTMIPCARMNSTNQENEMKWIERAACRFSTLADHARPIGDRRALHQPGQNGNRRGDEHGDEIGELLQAVVAGPALVDREVQRRILEGGRERGGEHAPGHGDQTKPLAGRENQHIKGDAVERPQQHDRKMPPAGKPYRVANARDTKPIRAASPKSSLEVQTRPSGTGCWKRNHSVPGVQSRVQYSRG